VRFWVMLSGSAPADLLHSRVISFSAGFRAGADRTAPGPAKERGQRGPVTSRTSGTPPVGARLDQHAARAVSHC
jgi:hypothetical protein